MTLNLDAGDIVAGLAFLLSAFATWKTYKFNQKQQTLIESQERLNQLLLDKEELESTSSREADLNANIVRLGNNKYRLKIFNKGKSTARNVRLEFPQGNDLIIKSELSQKFPIEHLERHQSVELIAAVHMGTKLKHTLKLIWNDDSGTNNEKIVYPTL